MTDHMRIRSANVDDTAAISKIWEAIVAERVYSAVDRAFTPEEQASYIVGLDRREAMFVAEED